MNDHILHLDYLGEGFLTVRPWDFNTCCGEQHYSTPRNANGHAPQEKRPSTLTELWYADTLRPLSMIAGRHYSTLDELYRHTYPPKNLLARLSSPERSREVPNPT